MRWPGGQVLAPYTAAIGEGALAAGQNAEQVREEDSNGQLSARQAALLAGSGALTGLIGFGANRLQRALGIGDIDTALATGRVTPQALAGQIAQASTKSLPRRIAESALSEGLFQELPQSAQEQIAQNLAQGKPWAEGVSQAAVMGALAGGLLGAAGGIARPEGQTSTPVGQEAPQASQPLALPAPVYYADAAGNIQTTEDINAREQHRVAGDILDATPIPAAPPSVQMGLVPANEHSVLTQAAATAVDNGLAQPAGQTAQEHPQAQPALQEQDEPEVDDEALRSIGQRVRQQLGQWPDEVPPRPGLAPQTREDLVANSQRAAANPQVREDSQQGERSDTPGFGFRSDDQPEAEYNQPSGAFDTRGGTVLNTDLARELSAEYRQDRSRLADIQTEAGDFIGRLYIDTNGL